MLKFNYIFFVGGNPTIFNHKYTLLVNLKIQLPHIFLKKAN
uniref:Uncharacterized protein n=1 Tax=Caloglossa monosticha TaxID=76906 RepID=A0A1Z1M5A0_9FLOR|nr:hypothetical protein [Caloglossa monosticha]ARW61023.1 hypothetical protein [Caloglossa monosticha]